MFCEKCGTKNEAGVQFCGGCGAVVNQGTPTAPADVLLGGYKWKVLEVQGDKMLLLSELIIERKAYHSSKTDATWENCDLRKYLNNEFYNKFEHYERDMIVETKLPNKSNQWYGTSSGNDTTDKIFLLSLEEVVKYFGDSGQLKYRPKADAVLLSDQYNEKRIAKDSYGSACCWWLRSPGCRANSAACVEVGGRVVMLGRGVDEIGGDFMYFEGNFLGCNEYVGPRPALWLNL